MQEYAPTSIRLKIGDHYIVGPAEEHYQIGEWTPPMPTMTFHLHAPSASLDAFTANARNMPVPLTFTVPRRAPKRRRHARGGLRPMVAAQVHHFTAHSMQATPTAAGPWRVDMRVTKWSSSPAPFTPSC